MVKVVISTCIGGYGLSAKAFGRLLELGYQPDAYEMKRYEEMRVVEDPIERSFHSLYTFDRERDNPLLIRVVEELGEEANSCGSELHIVEIPDGVNWYVHEDDSGYETVHETHRVWRYHRPD